ncbi:MAG: hypothetical protein DRO88_04955 [Promethearchaeia archaeon]|nr:MAG: hypothetical protein DRO88_04955 [Candidatus Lokiarchaeia archaeon]
MWGAIFGDIVGSLYEFRAKPPENFPLLHPAAYFTDDTVLTVAVADHFVHEINVISLFQQYGRRYSNCGFGARFYQWIWNDNPQPLQSWGNGAAMRISPVGWVASNEHEVLSLARNITTVSHNHPEGIRGAQAVAMAIFLAHRRGRNDAIRIGEKLQIIDRIESMFGYDLHTPLRERNSNPPPFFEWDPASYLISCQYSVPIALRIFMESQNFTDAIRKAVLLGGDTDTIACITGSIAEAFYGIPSDYIQYVCGKLPKEFISVINSFFEKFGH